MVRTCPNCEKEIVLEDGRDWHECFFECVVCGKLAEFYGEEMAVCKVCRLQEECEHLEKVDGKIRSTFLNGVCQQCGWICDHQDQEDLCCLDCGESNFDSDYADYLHDGERDRQIEEGDKQDNETLPKM